MASGANKVAGTQKTRLRRRLVVDRSFRGTRSRYNTQFHSALYTAEADRYARRLRFGRLAEARAQPRKAMLESRSLHMQHGILVNPGNL